MNVIDSYIRQLEKKVPKTEKVSEQLEEIRDTLHIKTEEYQAGGMRYEEAAKAAIRSVGDMSGLLNMVAGESREVYINRLNMANAFWCTIIITLEILVAFGLAFAVLGYDSSGNLTGPVFSPGNMRLFNVMGWGVLLPVIIAVLAVLWIWPAVSAVTYKRNPAKREVVRMPFKKSMITALVGWGAISGFLCAVNMSTDPHSIWFVWPLIGVSNWPVNIFNYHRQMTSGKFDV